MKIINSYSQICNILFTCLLHVSCHPKNLTTSPSNVNSGFDKMFSKNGHAQVWKLNQTFYRFKEFDIFYTRSHEDNKSAHRNQAFAVYPTGASTPTFYWCGEFTEADLENILRRTKISELINDEVGINQLCELLLLANKGYSEKMLNKIKLDAAVVLDTNGTECDPNKFLNGYLCLEKDKNTLNFYSYSGTNEIFLNSVIINADKNVLSCFSRQLVGQLVDR
jgi:hypothetical protein